MNDLGNWTAVISVFVTIASALYAAVVDFRRFRVPNRLTFSLCLSGLFFHGLVSGLAGLQHSAGGVAAGFAVLVAFYIMGVMGAGDVKLLAAIGAWIGAENTVYVFCVAGVVTGFHSVAVLAWQGRLREIPAIFQVAAVQMMTLGRHIVRADSATLASAVQRSDRRQCVVPFAVMIAIGVLVIAVVRNGV